MPRAFELLDPVVLLLLLSLFELLAAVDDDDDVFASSTFSTSSIPRQYKEIYFNFISIYS